VHVSSPALNGVNAIRFGCTYTLAGDCSAFVYVNGFFFQLFVHPVPQKQPVAVSEAGGRVMSMFAVALMQ